VDRLEQDDTVIGIYRKSLLYLISRSFEEDPRPAAILGMENYSKSLAARHRNLRIIFSRGSAPRPRYTQSDSHGGFDNDPLTMNSVLSRVLGGKPVKPFSKASLQY
jgi:hypothetical protein